jgi:anti-sigma-K factor RskA
MRGKEMEQENYPALFLDSDAASDRYQRTFLSLIQGEYWMLFLAAVFSMSFFSGVAYYVIYAGVFFIGLAILLVRSQSKPEQWWYRCRALAESVKTLTWRYMMRAAPFDGDAATARVKFRDELHEIFRQNKDTANKITNDWSGNHQITQAMDEVRGTSRANRLAYYLKHRVDEQRDWYKRKSRWNRKRASLWIWVSGIAYVLAAAMVLVRIALPNSQYWPIEPLIVVAASVIGWMQIKKFNELAATYTVTAHEIGLIRPMADAVKNEGEFSEFVNDAEKAFSREHTLWIARQSD